MDSSLGNHWFYHFRVLSVHLLDLLNIVFSWVQVYNGDSAHLALLLQGKQLTDRAGNSLISFHMLKITLGSKVGEEGEDGL